MKIYGNINSKYHKLIRRKGRLFYIIYIFALLLNQNIK